MYIHTTMIYITGLFTRITPYRQIVVEIDEKLYNLAAGWNAKCWKTDNNKYFIQVTLDKYDKQLIENRFEPLLKCKVGIKAINKEFTDQNGNVVKYALLKSIWKSKEKTKEEAKEASVPAATAIAAPIAEDDESDDSDEDLTEIEKQFKKLRQQEEEELQKQVDSLGK